MTKTYDEVITYNDAGLITKINVPSEINEILICPSSQQPTTTQGYVEGPQYGQETKLPPVAVDDHVTTDTNIAVMIDVLENDYDEDKSELSGKEALEIVDFSQGNKGRVEQKGNKLEYLPNQDDCGSDTFTYWIHDLDDGLSATAQVHIEIACPTTYNNGGYDVTEAVNQYGSELAPEAYDDHLMVQQNEMTLLYVLANDKDPNHPELSGRDALDIIDVTNGNKGEVHISIPSKRLRYVPNDGECGSDSFQYTVVNEAGFSDTATVYITINCDGGYDTKVDTGYGDDEKNAHIRELMDKLGDIACISKSDTFDDDDIKDKLCVNMEYEAVCNDNDKCGMYATECKGRIAFLGIMRPYEDMFDEATVSYEDDSFLVEYRKGSSCSGHYEIRTVIEYDFDKQCVSKWSDYYDDLLISDEELEDSVDKWMNKIHNECKYDSESGYI